MTEKVIGYLLLVIGIFFILFAGISVYQVFTKKAEPVKLFNFPGLSLDLSQAMSLNLPPEAKALLPQQPATAQKTELISGDMLNYSSNLLMHIMLMGFIAGIGQKLASIGTSLVRPIVVKLKAKEEIQQMSPSSNLPK